MNVQMLMGAPSAGLQLLCSLTTIAMIYEDSKEKQPSP